MMTVFIAVQCFQCSTMQVKQQKKSSNKWVCVVCNEKQSLQRVFARGNAAKDLRKFVQSFYMARKSADEQGTDMDIFHEENLLVEYDDNPNRRTDGQIVLGTDQDKKKRRVDWSEYIGVEKIPGDELAFNRVTGDENQEPNIITEWPDEVFKRPKFNHHVPGAGNCEKIAKKQRPFSKFEGAKVNHQQPRLVEGGESRRKEHVEGRDSFLRNPERFRENPTKSLKDAKLKASKWSRFIDGDEESQEGSYFSSSEVNDLSHRFDLDHHSDDIADRIVVEDVHPDFA